MFRSLAPGKYRVNAFGMRSGMSLKSALYGSNELTSGEFELGSGAAGPLILIMTTGGFSRVQGVVLDSKKHPVAGSAVWLIPNESFNLGYNLFDVTDQEGNFIISGRVGTYRLFFSEDFASYDLQQDPEFQKANQRNSMVVTLASGENPSLTLVLAPVK